MGQDADAIRLTCAGYFRPVLQLTAIASRVPKKEPYLRTPCRRGCSAADHAAPGPQHPLDNVPAR